MKYKSLTFCLGLLLFVAVGMAADPIGVISDDVILPPDLNTFNPPSGAGSSYIDPAFGTRILRVTDNSHYGEFVLGGYIGNSEICYFNKDGSYFIAAENDDINGERLIGTYLYDGHTGERLNLLGVYGTTVRPYWIRWALADRYKKDGQYVSFDPVYHFYKYEGNEIRLYDVRDIENYIVLHKFTEYDEIGPAGGEGDISGDGRYWVLDGDAQELFAYDLIDDIKYPASTFDLGSLGSKGGNVGVDYAAISPSGKYILVSWGTDAAANQQYAGIEMYDKNWNYIRQLHPSIVHWAMGIDHFGDEVIYTVVTHDFPDYFASVGATPGDLVSVRMSDGHQRLLKDIPIWAHMSITSCNYVTNGDYIYVAYHNRSDDPTDLWAPYWDEIFEVPTDGSQKARRFVHHRSHYVSGQSTKYYQPDAMVNRQGTKVIYRSTYNNGVGDLYMFDVGDRDNNYSDDIPPYPPTGLRMGEATFNSVELVWDQPAAASDGDYPSYYKVYRGGTFLADVYETRYEDFGLTESATYDYEIISVDKAGNQSTTSTSGSFSTLADVTPPAVVDLRIRNSYQLEVDFSEKIDAISSQNIANYSVDNNITVKSAVLLENEKGVLVTTSPMQLGIRYTLTMNNITDASKSKNEIAANTSRTFSLLSGFFDDFEDGFDPNWVFRTPDRWEIYSEENNQSAFLNTSDYGDYSTKMLGEVAIVDGSEQMGNDFRATCEAKSNEDLISNATADYAIVFGYIDDLNYYYVQFHPDDVKLHRIVNGERTLYEEYPFRCVFERFQRVSVELDNNVLRASVEGQQVFEYKLSTPVNGKIGIGSFNDSAWFDNVNIGPINQVDTTPPNAPSGLSIVREEN